MNWCFVCKEDNLSFGAEKAPVVWPAPPSWPPTMAGRLAPVSERPAACRVAATDCVLVAEQAAPVAAEREEPPEAEPAPRRHAAGQSNRAHPRRDNRCG